MYYLLFYETVENYVERRQPFRALHLTHAQEYADRGELLLAGAYANPADGATLAFQCESAETVQAFAEADPYVINGLITRWWVREWSVVLGSRFA